MIPCEVRLPRDKSSVEHLQIVWQGWSVPFGLHVLTLLRKYVQHVLDSFVCGRVNKTSMHANQNHSAFLNVVHKTLVTIPSHL